MSYEKRLEIVSQGELHYAGVALGGGKFAKAGGNDFFVGDKADSGFAEGAGEDRGGLLKMNQMDSHWLMSHLAFQRLTDQLSVVSVDVIGRKCLRYRTLFEISWEFGDGLHCGRRRTGRRCDRRRHRTCHVSNGINAVEGSPAEMIDFDIGLVVKVRNSG